MLTTVQVRKFQRKQANLKRTQHKQPKHKFGFTVAHTTKRDGTFVTHLKSGIRMPLALATNAELTS
jgi:hypothetical protein